MKLPRLATLIIGLSFIFGLMLWLVNSIYRLYIQIAFTAPILANILLLLIIGLLGLLIYVLLYYFYLLPQRQKSRRGLHSSSRPPLKLPVEKTEAAGETLKAIRQQVEQIQDKVTQQVFIKRSQEIERSLVRKEVKIIVFGTGSAGKTSLINALIGQMVGNVEATMGTTEKGETYSLKMKGVNREIQITDTPGILEIGAAGGQREQLARQLATEADLLLFVIDNDIRQSEYGPLLRLIDIGKRSLLVFNKIDLYSDEDQRRRQADKIIDRYQWIGAGVIAVTPLPVFDLLATAAVNAQMVREIGQVYGCEINSDRGKELALSLGKTLVSLGVVKGAVELLARILQLNFTTYIVGKAIQGVSAAYLTRIAGKSFIEYFRQDQDWGDGGMTEVVQRQFQLSRKEEFIKSFVADAIGKVVQPFQDDWQQEEVLEATREDDW